jgi:DNA-binding NarL/FixJ family response regulator
MVGTAETQCRLPMKILVVDDHVLIREALRGVLKELKDDAAIVEAPDSSRAMRHVEENPDLELVLLDLNLPDCSGFEVLAELRERYPAISVVVLSASNDRDDIARALDLGALGFIPKSAQREVMLSALKLIFAGGIYVPPEILGRRPPAPAVQPRSGPPLSAAKLGLTERQIDVLALMMEGKSNKAICRLLGIAEPTVKNHVTAILKALKATNRTEAVIAAGALGLGGRKNPG